MAILQILFLACVLLFLEYTFGKETGLSCDQLCIPLCQGNTDCGLTCKRTCNGVPSSRSTKDAYFSTRIAFELPANEIITSGDAPSMPPNHDFYFTTLNGKLYHYVVSDSPTSAMKLTMLFQVSPSRLDVRNGKGLFSVAIDRRFQYNNKLFLCYAMLPDSKEERRRFIPGSREDPNLLAPLDLDHYTTVQEVYMNGARAEPGAYLKKIEQYTPDAVGNWMGSLHPDPSAHGKENRLILATGGNPRQDGLLAIYGPHLSSMTVLTPQLNGGSTEEIWSSAIRRPVDCSTTYLQAGSVRCLLETEDKSGQANGTVLYSLKRGTNYGTPEFRRHCEQNSLGCKQRINDWFNRDGLLAFPSSDCPVRSMHIFTGSRTRMPSFYGKTLALRESCYRPANKEISEIELLYIDYNAGYGRWKATPLKLALEHRFLVNATLLGADNQNTLMIAGLSLTSGTVVVQELIPVKAGEFILQ